jgi:ATPase subunit of ABC transporter with duplicated ATPase domains
MPAHLTLERLSYATPDGVSLFDNLNLAFGAERTGLVGRNGVGKTTLLRLMLGELIPVSGSVSLRGEIGVLRQAMRPPDGATVADLLGVAADIDRHVRIEEGRGSEDDFANALWDLESRIAQAQAAVGMGGRQVDRQAATLSGGEATRLALAALLIRRPDLILLDEPTNNLDAEARALVAGVLAGWKGGAIVVSHDRGLLREMDRIVELSSLGAKVYGGNYDLYLERKAAEEAAAVQGLASAERTVARVAREAQGAREKKARRDAAGRRFAASGSAPKILLGAMAERAETSGAREGRLAEKLADQAGAELADAQAKVERLRRLSFELPSSGLAAGKGVLAFEAVTFAHPGGPVLAFDFRMTGPERVAVTGPNGAGKTTLIGLATGELEPASGQVRPRRARRPAGPEDRDAARRRDPGGGLPPAQSGRHRQRRPRRPGPLPVPQCRRRQTGGRLERRRTVAGGLGLRAVRRRPAAAADPGRAQQPPGPRLPGRHRGRAARLRRRPAGGQPRPGLPGRDRGGAGGGAPTVIPGDRRETRDPGGLIAAPRSRLSASLRPG